MSIAQWFRTRLVHSKTLIKSPASLLKDSQVESDLKDLKDLTGQLPLLLVVMFSAL